MRMWSFQSISRLICSSQSISRINWLLLREVMKKVFSYWTSTRINSKIITWLMWYNFDSFAIMMYIKAQNWVKRLSIIINSSWMKFREASESSKALTKGIFGRKSIRVIERKIYALMRTRIIEIIELNLKESAL